MSTYDKAFCPRLKEKDPTSDGYVSANKANEIFNEDRAKPYSERRIVNKREEFQCSENCELILTCINLSVDFSQKTNQNKISPYFANRIRNQKHNEKCLTRVDFINEHKKNKQKDSCYYFENQKIIFDFSVQNGLMSNINPTVKENGNSSISKLTNITKGINSDGKYKSNIKNKKKRTHHTNQLNTIIDLWEKYRSLQLDQKLYDKDGNEIQFNYFFSKVSGQQLDSEVHVYHDQAFCYRYYDLKKKEYTENLIIKFSSPTANLNGNNDRPSVLIFKNDFVSGRRKTFYKELEKYAQRWENDKKSPQSYFELYYLGRFINNGSHINFDIKENNFEHCLEIRPNPEN